MPQRKYTQLSSEERIVIETLLRSSAGVREIARMLNRSPSTISRELRRNQNFAKKTRVNKPKELRLDSRRFRGTAKVPVIREKKARYGKRLCQFERINYLAKSAQQKTLARCKKQSLLLELSRYQQTREFVKSRLRLRWSPEQIAGRLQIEINKRDKSASLLYVSPKAIYKYAKKYNLHKHLRRRGKKYRCSRIPAGWMSASKRNIATRPGVVDELGRLGDLEGDTIFGKDSRDRLLTHVERKTGLVSISLVRGYDVHKIQKQTILDLERLSRHTGALPKTITYDNGVEFAGWRQTEQELNTKIYFANPYHSWERGRNENTNGLIRDFFPKGTDFKKLTNRDILKVESMLNNRPRKRFQWLTPLEYAASLGIAVEE